MLRSLSLRNFQAWSKADIELSPITVVIGETNAGKSSLLRGLACVLFNAMEGQGMIRQGATVAEVTVETAEGSTISWHRGQSVNRYQVDEQLYDKPGRAVPQPVQDALQIQELEFDGEVVRMQWAPQMDAPFLLADSGAKATRMLGVAGTAAVVAQAARLAHQETRDNQDALRSAATQLAALQGQAETFGDVAAAEPVAEALRRALQDVADLRERRETLEQLYLRQMASAPVRTEARVRQAHAARLVECLRAWIVVRDRVEMLVAGTDLAARCSTAQQHLGSAETLVALARQRHRLEELKSLFGQAATAWETATELRGSLQIAVDDLHIRRIAHEELVASKTCAACGRVQEAA
jgi:energy-coupling factor transporter ATP-binding protein EcfA2